MKDSIKKLPSFLQLDNFTFSLNDDLKAIVNDFNTKHSTTRLVIYSCNINIAQSFKKDKKLINFDKNQVNEYGWSNYKKYTLKECQNGENLGGIDGINPPKISQKMLTFSRLIKKFDCLKLSKKHYFLLKNAQNRAFFDRIKNNTVNKSHFEEKGGVNTGIWASQYTVLTPTPGTSAKKTAVSQKDTIKSPTCNTSQRACNNLNFSAIMRELESIAIDRTKCNFNIYFDTEFYYRKDNSISMLSYQYSVLVGDNILSFVFLPQGESRFNRKYFLSLKSHLDVIIRSILLLEPKTKFSVYRKEKYLEAIRENKKRKKKDKIKLNVINLSLVSHFGNADLFNFRKPKEFKGKVEFDKQLISQLKEIQNGLVSIKPLKATFPLYKDKYVCNTEINVRDSFVLAPENFKSLEKLGNYCKHNKIEIDKKYKKNMIELYENDFKDFLAYAINDTIVQMCYFNQDHAINKILDVTKTAVVSSIFKKVYCEIHDIKYKNFDREFRGMKRETKKVYNEMLKKYFYEEELKPISISASNIHDITNRMFKGGTNQCFSGYVIKEKTNDIDLSSAYPSFLSMLYDIDFSKELTTLPVDIKINNFEDIDKLVTTTQEYIRFSKERIHRPNLFELTYELDKDVPIPFGWSNVDGSLIQARKINDYDVYSSYGLKLLLQYKAKIHIKRIIILPFKTCKGVYQTTMKEYFYFLLEERKRLKGTPLEIEVKMSSNATYGKMAQGTRFKTIYNAEQMKTVEMSYSPITCSYYASLCTEYIRLFLTDIMNRLILSGYKVYSVTTDGFITNASEDVLDELMKNDEMYREYKKTREELAQNDIVATKHVNNEYTLNMATRQNLALNKEGVIALGGLKWFIESKRANEEDIEIFKEQIKNNPVLRLRLYYLMLTNKNKIKSKSKMKTTLKLKVEKDRDFMLKEIIVYKSLDYDFKRKPINIEQISIDLSKLLNKNDFKGYEEDIKDWLEYESYELKNADMIENLFDYLKTNPIETLTFDTVAYDTLEEFKTMKDMKNKEKERIIKSSNFENLDLRLQIKKENNTINVSKKDIYKTYAQQLLRTIKYEKMIENRNIFNPLILEMTNKELIELFKNALDFTIKVMDCKNAGRKERIEKKVNLSIIEQYIEKLNAYMK